MTLTLQTLRTHEVKTLTELQVLVAENSEAIAPGCRVVAAGARLGRSIVDLVGLDAHDRPSLIAVGFTGNDAMLVRMTAAYAWALEYPESVRRLLPEGQAAGWPPRVVFIAEWVDDSFLSKLTALRFSAVHCFEFRHVETDGTARFCLDVVGSTGSTGTEPLQLPELLTTPCNPLAEAPADVTQLEAVGAAAMPAFGDLGPGANGARLSPGSEELLKQLAAAPDSRRVKDPGAAPVSELSAAAAVPQVVAAPPGATAAHDGWERLLPAVKLPPSGSLAPQWRRFFETAGSDGTTSGAVRESPSG